MAPIPATTNILLVKYEGAFGSRTVQCRFSDATSSSAAATTFRDYLIASVVPLWPVATLVTQWAWRAKGATFSLPIGSPGAVGGSNGSSVTAVDYPRYLSVSGRGLTTGKEVRMFFWGCVFSAQSDYRFTGTESTPVAQLWLNLPALVAAGGFRTDGGDASSPRTYANTGQNSYYQRKARGSS